ncbi:hypothetical protein C8Q77DRAFT_1159385 [Trametes polyzona]|nr:hypothetical protein C8Q77DRAFT_1159385 [Trametes polyzona]
MSTASHTPALTPSRSPTPELPLQPDHFYGNEDIRLPPSPNSDGRTWLDPADDPLAQRGIPVFKPTMEEFADFEGYMNRVEPWGMRSGIVKVIPPKEWTEALPSVVPQLDKVKLKNPIEQHMLGQGGLFQQQNIEKRRVLSVREWAEMCAKEELRAPGVDEIGLHARAANGATRRPRRGRKQRASETVEPEHQHDESADAIKREDEEMDVETAAKALISPPNSNRTLSPVDHNDQQQPPEQHASTSAAGASASANDAGARHPLAEEEEEEEEEEAKHEEEEEVKPKPKGRRPARTREDREAMMAERAAKDREFLQTFDPHTAWLPPKTNPESYTTEFCKELERRYWRNCGFGKPAWYGADMQGSLFTDDTTSWNVACLPSALTRLLPASDKGLPGVNTPYLYFGMWRATFAWHVEDMDLFSINYIHFGAPKFWYAMPQARANALEQTMRSLFPGAGKNCSQFLRHKSYLASPTLLSKSSCKPNYLVQQAGEFVITFPRGYHAGFNLGFNCAESVNFALESWIEIGKKAKACGCVNFSVRIDVEQLLRDRAAEKRDVYRKQKKPKRIKNESAPALDKENKPKSAPRKRKAEGDAQSKAKRQKTKPASAQEQPVASSSKLPLAPPTLPKTLKVTLKLPPKPKEPDTFPCCLCVSMSQEGLLLVQDPPAWWYEPGNPDAAGGNACMAHAECANVVPETWIDEVEMGEPDESGERRKERRVFGVDGIVKDRWNLKCTACTKTRHRAHGAPIQCTKGKCPKAFHVSCARDGHASGIVFKVLREVEKEVVLLDGNQAPAATPAPTPASEPAPTTLSAPLSEAASSSPADAGLATGQPMDVDPAMLTVARPVAMSSEPLPAEFQSQSEAQPPQQPQYQHSPSPQVLKRIRKTEVEVLCHQHNPAVLAAKKAQAQDRIRNQLLALPPMSRIKLRVTAGVFEVTLLRVLEESHSVEVLWDRGLRREFKWRSVVFGETDAVVGQKPTEAAAPEHEPGSSVPTPTSTTPRVSYPPTGSAPPPSYRPSPAIQPSLQPQTQSSSSSHSNSPIPPPAATGTPTYASPAPVTTPAPQAPSTYRPPAGATYAQQPAYHPPASTYQQYAPGNWAYQYPGASYNTSQTSQHYASSSSQPPSHHYPPTSYASYPTSYPPGTYPPANNHYRYPYSRPAYGSYGSYYNGYSYAPPPPPSAPAQTQTQASSSSSHPQAYPSASTPAPAPAPATAQVPPPPPAAPAQTQTQTQPRGLQWQKPYTGPKKAQPLAVPSVPSYYSSYAPPAPAPAPVSAPAPVPAPAPMSVPAPAPVPTAGGSRPSSSHAPAPAAPTAPAVQVADTSTPSTTAPTTPTVPVDPQLLASGAS